MADFTYQNFTVDLAELTRAFGPKEFDELDEVTNIIISEDGKSATFHTRRPLHPLVGRFLSGS